MKVCNKFSSHPVTYKHAGFALFASGTEKEIHMEANKSGKYLLIDGSSSTYAADVKYCLQLVQVGKTVFISSN